MPVTRLPNFSNVDTIRHFLATTAFFAQGSLNQDWVLRPERPAQNIWLAPVALSATSAWGLEVAREGGSIQFEGDASPGLRYAIRLGLFDFLGIEHDIELEQHEEAGRFIALRQIRNSTDQEKFLTDLQPLLHQAQSNTWAIRHSMSEMLRNVLEHSNAPEGAVACAQYHPNSKYVSIGVADCGIGIRQSLSQNYPTNSDLEAVLLAVRPYVSGARSTGQPWENAGLGLFVTKSIARIGHQEFALASGDAFYKLRKNNKGPIEADPTKDNASFSGGLPPWRGTLVGVHVSTTETKQREFFAQIRKAMPGRKKRQDFSRQVQFS